MLVCVDVVCGVVCWVLGVGCWCCVLVLCVLCCVLVLLVLLVLCFGVIVSSNRQLRILVACFEINYVSIKRNYLKMISRSNRSWTGIKGWIRFRLKSKGF